MEYAIDECIEKGILVKFLKKHRLEVRDMSLEEFDVEEYTEMIKEDSFNEGIAEGKTEGDLERGIRTAKRMRERGDDIAYIADTLEETEEQIEKWLAIPSDE